MVGLELPWDKIPHASGLTHVAVPILEARELWGMKQQLGGVFVGNNEHSLTPVNELYAENTRLRKALEIYAKHSNWDYRRGEGYDGDIIIDGYIFDPKEGNKDEPWLIAQEALKEK